MKVWLNNQFKTGYMTRGRWILIHMTVFLSMAAYRGFAQSLPLNTAEKQLIFARMRKSPPDSVKVDLIWQLGRYQLAKVGNFKVDLDSGMYYYQWSLRWCDSARLRANFKYESLCRIGETYFRLNNFKQGKASFMEVVKAYQDAGDQGREARTWLRLGTKLKIADPHLIEILGYDNRALKLYRELKERMKEADVLQEIGSFYQVNNKLDSAQVKLLQALNIFKSIKHNNLAALYNSLAYIHRIKGNLNASLSYSIKCINNCVERGDTLNVLTLPSYYGQLGSLYAELNKLEQSIPQFQKAIEVSLSRAQTNVASDRVYFYTVQIVRAHILLKRNDAAQEAIRLLTSKYPPADSAQVGLLAEMMGQYYAAGGKYSLAEQQYLKMTRYYKGKANEEWGNKVLGTYYLDRKMYDKASGALKTLSIRLPKTNETFITYVENEYLYYQIDSAKGDLVSALKHFVKFKKLSDSAYNVKKSKEIEELQIQYETAQKEKDIVFLTKDGAQQRANAAQAGKIRNITLSGIGLLILFTGFLYNSFRLNRRRNRVLNQLVIEKDELLIEKEWLLKEIHHRVKNNLQIVMGLLKRQSAYIDNDIALAAIQNSENRMHAISLIHQKLYQTNNLDLISLPEYIDDLISFLKSSFDLGSRIYFEKNVEENYLDISQAVPLGLILNEAITNAIKYAYSVDEPGSLGVSLIRSADGLFTLTITDHGKGLPPGFDADNVSSLGLNLMKGLSKQLGGKLKIIADGGVTISVSFKPESPVRTEGETVEESYL